MGLYELDKMHQAGYIHGDYHYENVLINPSYNYFEKNSGRAIIIDFGCSTIANNEESRLEMLQYEMCLNQRLVPSLNHVQH